MTYKLFVTPGTGRFYFKLYDENGKVEGTYGRGFGWPTRDDATSAAIDRIRDFHYAA
jgi:hypothetical protein